MGVFPNTIATIATMTTTSTATGASRSAEKKTHSKGNNSTHHLTLSTMFLQA